VIVLKIAVIDPMFHWPPHGGACVDLKETATRLQRDGFDMHLFVPTMHKIWPRGVVDENSLDFSVHKIRTSFWSLNRFSFPNKVRKEVDKIKPDYVIVGDSFFFKPALIKALKNYKVVTRFYAYDVICPNDSSLLKKRYKSGTCNSNYLEKPRECMSCAMSDFFKWSIFSSRLDIGAHEFLMNLAFMPDYHRLAIESLSSCHAIIVYNDMIKNILSRYNKDIYIIPGGVDTKRFVPKKFSRRDGRKNILMAGRILDFRKGGNLLWKAGKILSRKRDDFRIQLTMSPTQTVGNFEFIGWKNGADLVKSYQRCDICVVPSIWEEPFGLVALEAMSCGKPVIGSDVTGLRLSVKDGETGLIFKNGSVTDLVKKIEALLDDSGMRKRMGIEARRVAEDNFDWEVIANMYKEVLS